MKNSTVSQDSCLPKDQKDGFVYVQLVYNLKCPKIIFFLNLTMVNVLAQMFCMLKHACKQNLEAICDVLF